MSWKFAGMLEDSHGRSRSCSIKTMCWIQTQAFLRLQMSPRRGRGLHVHQPLCTSLPADTSSVGAPEASPAGARRCPSPAPAGRPPESPAAPGALPAASQLLQGSPAQPCRQASERGGSSDDFGPGLSAEGRHASPHLHMLQHSPACKHMVCVLGGAAEQASSVCRAPLHSVAGRQTGRCGLSRGLLGAQQAAPFSGCVRLLMHSPTVGEHCL